MNNKPIWKMIYEAVSDIGSNVDVVEVSDINICYSDSLRRDRVKGCSILYSVLCLKN